MIKVISFSLWGDKLIYNIGSIENAKLAKQIYPDFYCWFYCHKESVPNETIENLLSFDNTKIIFKEDLVRSSSWRFEAIDDPEVEIMLSRDADSRLSMREKNAVEEWLLSEMPFHIMRDHPNHLMPIMAGMFGCKKTKEIPSWKDLLCNISSSHYGNDQDFLKNHIYPIIKNQSVIHASHNKIEGIECKDFFYRELNEFVGEIITP